MSSDNSNQVDLKRRKILTGATGVLGAVGATFLAVPFVSSWQPSAKARAAGAPVDANLSALQMGQMMTVAWRGKPIYVVKRTPEMLKNLTSPSLITELRDPKSESSEQPESCQNPDRAINPEYLVVVGVCTHLGCAPLYRPAVGSPDVGADWQGGFFCPCHGSKFDLAGRVFKSVPAPTNLVIPPYYFMTKSEIRIGENKAGGQA